MITETITYVADEQSFAGLLCYDEADSSPKPGVLVCHGGAGLDAHARRRARRLAELGYFAFALDLFGPPFESREQGMATIRALVGDPPRLRRRAGAALQVLRDHPLVDADRTAAIGFCLGGLVALELARAGEPLVACVAFHGGLGTAAPAKPGSVKAQLLVCSGADDPVATVEQRAVFEDEMREAGADWRMIVYGRAVHGFTHEDAVPGDQPGVAYHRPSDERSWRAMLDLFDEAFAAPTP